MHFEYLPRYLRPPAFGVQRISINRTADSNRGAYARSPTSSLFPINYTPSLTAGEGSGVNGNTLFSLIYIASTLPSIVSNAQPTGWSALLPGGANRQLYYHSAGFNDPNNSVSLTIPTTGYTTILMVDALGPDANTPFINVATETQFLPGSCFNTVKPPSTKIVRRNGVQLFFLTTVSTNRTTPDPFPLGDPTKCNVYPICGDHTDVPSTSNIVNNSTNTTIVNSQLYSCVFNRENTYFDDGQLEFFVGDYTGTETFYGVSLTLFAYYAFQQTTFMHNL